MAITLSVNGQDYVIPQQGDPETGWGTAVTGLLQALVESTLQLTGGDVILTADVNFGANFGIKLPYVISATANPASAGFLRQAQADEIKWRNAANDGDLTLGVSSDALQWEGINLQPLTTNEDIIVRRGGQNIRLPKGTDGQVLAIVAGVLTYTTAGNGDTLSAGTHGDNVVPRYDGANSKTIQPSALSIDDSGNATGLNDLGLANDLTVGRDNAVTRNQTVGGNNAVTGDETVGGTLDVTGHTTLSTLLYTNTPKNLGLAFEFEGSSGGASSTTDAFAKMINQGGIINAISLSSEDFNAAAFDSTNKKFGAYSFALNGSRTLAASGQHNNLVKGTLSTWFRNLAAGDAIACNPLLGITLALDGSGFLTTSITEKIAASETTKNTLTVTGADDRSADTTFRHVAMKYRTNDEGGASTDLLELEYEGADEGTQLTSQDIDIEAGDGGLWFMGAKINEPAWDHFSAMSVLPDDEASGPWTLNGTDTNNAVSNGVLTIDTLTEDGTTTSNYTRTDLVDLTQQTIEFKVSVPSTGANSFRNTFASFIIRDDSLNRTFAAYFFKDRVDIFNQSSTSEQYHVVTLYTDFTKSRLIRFTSQGSPNPTMNFYIDGMLLSTFANSESDTTSNDLILFGDTDAGSGDNAVTKWEFFKIFDAGAIAPTTLATQGNIDSFGIANVPIDSATLALLQENPITDVFGVQPNQGIYEMPIMRNEVDTEATEVSGGSYNDKVTWRNYFFGDGLNKQKINFQASLSCSSAGGTYYAAIDVDGDVDGKSPTDHGIQSAFLIEDPDGDTEFPVNLERAIVSSPGLHTADFCMASSSGTAQSRSRTINLTTSQVTNKKLGG